MYLSKSDIEQTERLKRLNIINSVSGIKPGNLIGTRSDDGHSNLAIISSVVHLGSNPPFLGFIMRPPTPEARRHTYENITANQCFTINHIHSHFIDRAHYTSAKFEEEVSEFEECGLTEEFLFDFKAPFVKESSLKIGLKHVESIPIKSSGTIMIVGAIEHLIIPDHSIDEQGYINLEDLDNVGISGLNGYYKLKKVKELPYARVKELPNFKNEKATPAK